MAGLDGGPPNREHLGLEMTSAKHHLPAAQETSNKFPFRPGRSVREEDPMLRIHQARVAAGKPVVAGHDNPDDDDVVHIPAIGGNAVIEASSTFVRDPNRPPEILPKKFGLRVRIFRRRLRLTYVELARRSGLSATAIVKIEAGKRSPTLTSGIKLSRALGVSFDQLVRGLDA